MRYHGDHHVLPLFGPWRWAPYMRGNFHWKKYQNARSFFLSHTSKLNQQKQWEVVSKSTAKIYPSNKYNIFPSFIIDQSWNTLQLKNIVLSFHPPFEPISALFTFTGLWPVLHSYETFYIVYYCITSIVIPNALNIYQQNLYKENIIYVLGDFSIWVLHVYRMQRVLLWQFIKCKVGLFNVSTYICGRSPFEIISLFVSVIGNIVSSDL